MKIIRKYWWIVIVLIIVFIVALSIILNRVYIGALLGRIFWGKSPPMTATREGKICDLNLDDRCDATDFALFNNTLDKCLGDEDYDPIGDANEDGCVTLADRQMLFPDSLGPETESFFDKIIQQMQKFSPKTPPMEEMAFEACDLDFDGDCDQADQEVFNDAFGKCRGEPGYNFNADIDGDGCVVTADKEALFPENRQ